MPHVNPFSHPDVHHGLAAISSVLKSSGHRVSLHHVGKEPSKNKILNTVQRERPDLIAFSSVTHQIGYVDTWSSWIKQEFDTPTICGGIHATLYPEEIIGFSGIDMVCRGEGEYPMLELADDLKRTDIKNLWIKSGRDIIKNPLRPLISSLDELPFPDYDIFDCNNMLKDLNGKFSIMASRGCPFPCTYCCNHALRGVQAGQGRYLRVRSVENFLSQLELLADKYPVKRWTFADDIFGIDRKWALEFCEKYPKKFALEFKCNARADTIDEELLESLKSANCTQLDIGIEVGNEWLRNEVLRKKISNEQIIKAFDGAHKVGLKTCSYNMVGLPYETPEMIEETISLNKRVAPDEIGITVFYPFPGTELYEVCKKEGFLSEKRVTSFLLESILELPTLTPKELRKLHIKFHRCVIDWRIQRYHPLLRLSFKIMSFVVFKLFGNRTMTIKMFLKFF